MVSNAPPETPPMLDPSSFRYPRLTPNLREMIQGFSQGPADSSGSMNDLFASLDPNAVYNSLQVGSPILRDLCTTQSPVQPSTVPYDSPDIFAERTERMAGAAAEMNALFNNCYPNKSVDITCSDDANQSGGIMSLMSSPELKQGGTDASRSGVSSTHQKKQPQALRVQKTTHASQSSSQTPPPVDETSMSPAESPEVVVKRVQSRKQAQPAPSLTKPPQASEKRARETSKPTATAQDEAQAAGSTTKSDVRTESASASASGTKSSTPCNEQRGAASRAPMAAARPMAISTGMGGFIPFACAMPGMGTMLQMPGALHYQGRPMALMNGVHGAELIPVDVLAQATALQYGAAAAAQAAADQMMQSSSVESDLAQQAKRGPPDALGGSRKKRRRQLLERSGCSEEQARQNRAHAMERLRQKKTLRTQQSTVRYACRKRIAMVRPRVNGRFATKEEVEECQRTTQQ